MIHPFTGALCVLMLAACLLPSLGFAQEETQKPAQKETQADPKPDKKKPKDEKKSEIFVPTEEISEDYSVSFPVDI